MRAIARYLMPALPIIAAVAIAVGAYGLASRAWDGVVSYRSPYAEVPLPDAVAGPRVADRVVLVVIDGLRRDAARDMPSLTALRRYGADFRLVAPQPSLSYPNWTTILTGTNQDYHGVVTNWHEGAAPVETLFDTAERAGVPYIVVGPSDIATLFPAATRADSTFFREWSDEYLTGTYVDAVLRATPRFERGLVFLHMPDIDEAGHDYGGDSREYARTVARVDADLRRLVEGLQDRRTTFVVVADHGHIDSGGHGGWEPDVVGVPGVMAGAGVRVAEGSAPLEDVAPTVAVLAGIPVPRHATGEVLGVALAPSAARGMAAAGRQRSAAVNAFTAVASGARDAGRASAVAGESRGEALTVMLESARRERLRSERSARTGREALWIALATALALVAVAVASWRAALSALAGTGAYYAVYNALFFGVHGNRWSLSSFNSEDLIDAWMNQRLVEAAIAGLVGALVAGLVYPMLRRAPQGPWGRYLPGWLALGPVTVLVVQSTLAFQVAWFIGAWGITPVWALPDLRSGFKFDLDLIQLTALGAAALLAPVVTYLAGRYHPSIRTTNAGRA